MRSRTLWSPCASSWRKSKPLIYRCFTKSRWELALCPHHTKPWRSGHGFRLPSLGKWQFDFMLAITRKAHGICCGIAKPLPAESAQCGWIPREGPPPRPSSAAGIPASHSFSLWASDAEGWVDTYPWSGHYKKTSLLFSYFLLSPIPLPSSFL